MCPFDRAGAGHAVAKLSGLTLQIERNQLLCMSFLSFFVLVASSWSSVISCPDTLAFPPLLPDPALFIKTIRKLVQHSFVHILSLSDIANPILSFISIYFIFLTNLKLKLPLFQSLIILFVFCYS